MDGTMASRGVKEKAIIEAYPQVKKIVGNYARRLSNHTNAMIDYIIADAVAILVERVYDGMAGGTHEEIVQYMIKQAKNAEIKAIKQNRRYRSRHSRLTKRHSQLADKSESWRHPEFTRQELEQLFPLLSKGEKNVLFERYRGKDNEEIARETGTNNNNVGTQVYNMRKKVMKVYPHVIDSIKGNTTRRKLRRVG